MAFRIDSAWRWLDTPSGPANGRHSGDARLGFWPGAITQRSAGCGSAKNRW